MNRIKISKNFSLHEFECKDGSQLVKIDSKLLDILQKLRDHFSRAITINSGYRTPSHNKRVGGASNSQHLYGTAADIVIYGVLPKKVAVIARRFGATGIGIYNTFTHVDTRKKYNTSRGYDYWTG